MGCGSSSSSAHGGDDMIGNGSYNNLNPYLAKKESALFRQRIAQILDSVRVQSLGSGPGAMPPKGMSLALARKRERSTGSDSSSNRATPRNSPGGSPRSPFAPSASSSFSGGGSGGGGGSCGVVQGSVDEHGQPLEITQHDLRSIAAVLRVFDAPVQNEIVGACLLARPADVHAYAYDYSKSCVLTIRIGGPNVGTVVSAAVVTLRIIDESTRCLEVSWVATLREHRKRGYAALLFGYVQQIAAVMGIEAVLVLSSRTSVGYWLNQPRAPGHKRIIMVRSAQSSKRLSKGYSKYPWKKRKLENGLRRADAYEEPPSCVQKFYNANSSFRFNHSNSIHVWYQLGLTHVDYLSLSRTRVAGGPGGSGGGLRFRSARNKNKKNKKMNKMSTREKLKSKHGVVTSGDGGGGGSFSERPKRSKSWSGARGRGGGGGSSGGDRVSRSSSFSAGAGASHGGNMRQGSVYKMREVSAAKLMARRLKQKADSKKQAAAQQGGGSVYAVVGGGVSGSRSPKKKKSRERDGGGRTRKGPESD